MKKIFDHDYYIFDCDGVVLNSNQIKNQAFRKSLSNQSIKNIKSFIDYHKKNGGISRYEKFQYFFNEINYVKNSKLIIQKCLEEYSNFLKTKLVKCQYVEGVIDFIKRLYELNKRIYVISGSDEKELIQIFKKRKIFYLFNKIYGSPKSKLKNFSLLNKKNEIYHKGIFFGDSKVDFEVSKEFDIDFIFISQYSEWLSGKSVINKKNILKNFKNIKNKNI